MADLNEQERDKFSKYEHGDNCELSYSIVDDKYRLLVLICNCGLSTFNIEGVKYNLETNDKKCYLIKNVLTNGKYKVTSVCNCPRDAPSSTR